jgi:putative DNA primase/helicase
MEETRPVVPDTDGPLPYRPDDDQITALIVGEWDGGVAYFYSEWQGYERGVWNRRDIQEVKRAIRKFLRPHRKVLPNGISQARINALTAMLEDDLFVSDRRLMEQQAVNAKYINLQNGLFNLQTFQLEPHCRELYFTNQLSFSYEPDADCPHFRRFLNTSLVDEFGQTDHEMIQLVQEALAYSMTARTDLKSSFWLVGKPDSGKSTLISFIRKLMGSLHTTIDLNQLAENRFMLANIVGKRVVTFTEADSNAFIPDALYKAMVGGKDELFVDVKNKPGVTFVPEAKFWWGMNKAPRFNDRTGATLNRLRVILFDRSIPPEERILNLDALLEAEKPGVFNWLMYGYQRLQRTGQFTLPGRSQRWRDQYALENDTERTYANDRLDFDPAASISSQELFKDYKSWCEEFGFKPKNMQQVAPEWRRLGLVDKGNQGRKFWHGAKLRPYV